MAGRSYRRGYSCSSAIAAGAVFGLATGFDAAAQQPQKPLVPKPTQQTTTPAVIYRPPVVQQRQPALRQPNITVAPPKPVAQTPAPARQIQPQSSAPVARQSPPPSTPSQPQLTPAQKVELERMRQQLLGAQKTLNELQARPAGQPNAAGSRTVSPVVTPSTRGATIGMPASMGTPVTLGTPATIGTAATAGLPAGTGTPARAGASVTFGSLPRAGAPVASQNIQSAPAAVNPTGVVVRNVTLPNGAVVGINAQGAIISGDATAGRGAMASPPPLSGLVPQVPNATAPASAGPNSGYVRIDTTNGPAYFQKTQSGLMVVSDQNTLQRLRSGALPANTEPAIAPGANRFASPSAPVGATPQGVATTSAVAVERARAGNQPVAQGTFSPIATSANRASVAATTTASGSGSTLGNATSGTPGSLAIGSMAGTTPAVAANEPNSGVFLRSVVRQFDYDKSNDAVSILRVRPHNINVISTA